MHGHGRQACSIVLSCDRLKSAKSAVREIASKRRYFKQPLITTAKLIFVQQQKGIKVTTATNQCRCTEEATAPAAPAPAGPLLSL
jgi:hypothetical protein